MCDIEIPSCNSSSEEGALPYRSISCNLELKNEIINERKYIPFDINDKIKIVNKYGEEEEVLYTWMRYTEEIRSKIYKNYKTMLREVGRNLYRVLAVIVKSELEYIVKDNSRDLMASTKSENFLYKTKLRYKREKVKKSKKNISKIHMGDSDSESEIEEGRKIKRENEDSEDEDQNMEIKSTTLGHIMEELKDEKLVPMYRGIINDPDYKEYGDLNLWRGFKAKIIEGWSEPSENLKFFLNFLKNVICERSIKCFRYLLRLLKEWLFNPSNKVPICLLLLGKDNTGKMNLFDFIRYHVMGKDACWYTMDINETMSNYECLHGRKLLLINDMHGIPHKNDFRNFETNLRTKDIRINCKSKHLIKCLLQFIIMADKELTRGTDIYKMSFCLQIKEMKLEYHTELRDKCFNDETGSEFYTYLNSLDLSNIVLNNIPLTKLRYNLIQMNLPKIERFLKYCFENRKLIIKKGIKSFVPVHMDDDILEIKDGEENRVVKIIEDEIKDEKEGNTDEMISRQKFYSLYIAWIRKYGILGFIYSQREFNKQLKEVYFEKDNIGCYKNTNWYDLNKINPKIWNGGFRDEGGFYPRD
jgi:hypothetical protein